MRKVILMISLLMFQNTAFSNDEKILVRVNELLKATEENNYEAFQKNGSTDFRAIKKSDFEKVSHQLSKHLKSGSTLTFLTTYKQGGSLIHLYKITFKDNSNDFLVKIVLSENGETLGFWIA